MQLCLHNRTGGAVSLYHKDCQAIGLDTYLLGWMDDWKVEDYPSSGQNPRMVVILDSSSQASHVQSADRDLSSGTCNFSGPCVDTTLYQV